MRWSKRDLSAKHYVYFWADGVHVQARLEDAAQCLLVIIGATPEGKKELVGLIDGVRESAQILEGAAARPEATRTCVAPKLAIADGALGFWQAIEEVWPQTREPTLLGAQDRQCAEQAAEEPAVESQAGPAGDLDGRNQEGCARGVRCLCRDLGRQIRQGGRMSRQGSRCATGLLRVPGRALETPAHDQRHRKLVRHRASPHRALEGMSFE